MIPITTVITPAANYDLTSIEFVLDELNLSDTANEAMLKRWITQASAAARSYCNRVFQVETVKDEFWPPREGYPWLLSGGLAPLQLTRWPITAAGVASVIENAVTLVDGTDFRVDYEKGQLIRLDNMLYPRRWPAWPISVQYAAGYTTIPEDVADAVLRMVRGRFYARGRDPMLRQENLPGVRETQYWVATGSQAGNMPPDVEDMLDNYRVPQLG